MTTELKPQEGPQELFLSSPADIVIYGGSAGSGKSYGLLLEPLRHVTNNPLFSAVIFRRNIGPIRNPGSLWDTSLQMYGQMPDAHPTSNILEWTWVNGGKIKMGHLEYDKTVFDWHGSQIPLIMFDELTEFTAFQFWYMLSRNRSMSGVDPYIRCTCNPDPDSFVADLIAWWIDQESGFPIPERAGKLRYFIRVKDDLLWADTPEELAPELHGLPTHAPNGAPIDYMPKSLTFIPATIFDNKKLMQHDPKYLANLLALPEVERARLLGGNWKVRPSAGLYFKRQWVTMVEEDQVPKDLEINRGWDLASTEKLQTNDPDWTAGTKIARCRSTGRYYVMDHVRTRANPGDVERFLKATAAGDGKSVRIRIPQDPGAAGKAQAVHLVQQLDGYPVSYQPASGDKATRFSPFSAMAKVGMVSVVIGPWNNTWFASLEAFPDGAKDDDVDSTSEAFNGFIDATTGLINYYTQEADKVRKEAEARKKGPPQTVEEGGVRVRPPRSDINMLYDQKGRALWLQPDGTFIVDEKHAKLLRRSGFEEVRA